MRIALVAHTNAPWTPHYARFFKEKGHEVRIFSYHPVPLEGISTVLMVAGPPREEIPKYRYLTTVLKLKRELARFEPHVVLASYLISNGLAASLAWRGPLVVSARGGDVLGQSRRRPLPSPIHRAILRLACRRAHRVHAVSEEIVDSLSEAGLPREKIVCFPVGVDADVFHPGPRVCLGGMPHIVCTRTQGSVYHNDLLVDAAARLRRDGRVFRMTFAASGPLLEERRKQVQTLALQDWVRFEEGLPHERMADFLRTGDVYVSASSSDGTSSSLLEALAVGLTPVVSRIRANLPWVRDGDNGFLFTVGDADDLALALSRALDEANVRTRARTENPRMVRERANLQRNNQRLLDLLVEAAGGKSVVAA